jgi:hypothetical protein
LSIVQVAIFETSLNKYKDLIRDDYDNKFKVYEKYIKAQIPEQMDKFMASSKVDKYFQCHEIECDVYECQPPVDMPTRPKFEFPLEMVNRTHIPNATFILTGPKGFYRDIDNTWGIEQEWIRLG